MQNLLQIWVLLGLVGYGISNRLLELMKLDPISSLARQSNDVIGRDLVCRFNIGSQCCWGVGSGGVQMGQFPLKSRAVPEFHKKFKTFNLPDDSFAVFQNDIFGDGRSVLLSCPMKCAIKLSFHISFRYWLTEGARLDVCVQRKDGTFHSCRSAPREVQPGPMDLILTALGGQKGQRVAIVAHNVAGESMALVDNIDITIIGLEPCISRKPLRSRYQPPPPSVTEVPKQEELILNIADSDENSGQEFHLIPNEQQQKTAIATSSRYYEALYHREHHVAKNKLRPPSSSQSFTIPRVTSSFKETQSDAERISFAPEVSRPTDPDLYDDSRRSIRSQPQSKIVDPRTVISFGNSSADHNSTNVPTSINSHIVQTSAESQHRSVTSGVPIPQRVPPLAPNFRSLNPSHQTGPEIIWSETASRNRAPVPHQERAQTARAQTSPLSQSATSRIFDYHSNDEPKLVPSKRNPFQLRNQANARSQQPITVRARVLEYHPNGDPKIVTFNGPPLPGAVPIRTSRTPSGGRTFNSEVNPFESIVDHVLPRPEGVLFTQTVLPPVQLHLPTQGAARDASTRIQAQSTTGLRSPPQPIVLPIPLGTPSNPSRSLTEPSLVLPTRRRPGQNTHFNTKPLQTVPPLGATTQSPPIKILPTQTNIRNLFSLQTVPPLVATTQFPPRELFPNQANSRNSFAPQNKTTTPSSIKRVEHETKSAGAKGPVSRSLRFAGNAPTTLAARKLFNQNEQDARGLNRPSLSAEQISIIADTTPATVPQRQNINLYVTRPAPFFPITKRIIPIPTASPLARIQLPTPPKRLESSDWTQPILEIADWTQPIATAAPLTRNEYYTQPKQQQKLQNQPLLQHSEGQVTLRQTESNLENLLQKLTRTQQLKHTEAQRPLQKEDQQPLLEETDVVQIQHELDWVSNTKLNIEIEPESSASSVSIIADSPRAINLNKSNDDFNPTSSSRQSRTNNRNRIGRRGKKNSRGRLNIEPLNSNDVFPASTLAPAAVTIPVRLTANLKQNRLLALAKSRLNGFDATLQLTTPANPFERSSSNEAIYPFSENLPSEYSGVNPFRETYRSDAEEGNQYINSKEIYAGLNLEGDDNIAASSRIDHSRHEQSKLSITHQQARPSYSYTQDRVSGSQLAQFNNSPLRTVPPIVSVTVESDKYPPLPAGFAINQPSSLIQPLFDNVKSVQILPNYQKEENNSQEPAPNHTSRSLESDFSGPQISQITVDTPLRTISSTGSELVKPTSTPFRQGQQHTLQSVNGPQLAEVDDVFFDNREDVEVPLNYQNEAKTLEQAADYIGYTSGSLEGHVNRSRISQINDHTPLRTVPPITSELTESNSQLNIVNTYPRNVYKSQVASNPSISAVVSPPSQLTRPTQSSQNNIKASNNHATIILVKPKTNITSEAPKSGTNDNTQFILINKLIGSQRRRNNSESSAQSQPQHPETSIGVTPGPGLTSSVRPAIDIAPVHSDLSHIRRSSLSAAPLVIDLSGLSPVTSVIQPSQTEHRLQSIYSALRGPTATTKTDVPVPSLLCDGRRGARPCRQACRRSLGFNYKSSYCLPTHQRTQTTLTGCSCELRYSSDAETTLYVSALGTLVRSGN